MRCGNPRRCLRLIVLADDRLRETLHGGHYEHAALAFP
jgi:hypothetical protein